MAPQEPESRGAAPCAHLPHLGTPTQVSPLLFMASTFWLSPCRITTLLVLGLLAQNNVWSQGPDEYGGLDGLQPPLNQGPTVGG